MLVALTRSAQAAFHQLPSLPPASRWVLNHINGSSSERGNLALKIPFQKKENKFFLKHPSRRTFIKRVQIYHIRRLLEFRGYMTFGRIFRATIEIQLSPSHMGSVLELLHTCNTPKRYFFAATACDKLESRRQGFVNLCHFFKD